MIQKILFKFSLTKTLIHYFFIHELHAACLVKQPGRQPLVERVVKIYVCAVVAILWMMAAAPSGSECFFDKLHFNNFDPSGYNERNGLKPRMG